MSPATLNTRAEHRPGQTLPVRLSGDFLSSRIGVRLREQRCPFCNSIVYTRRHSRCGVCEELLPERVLFSRAEAEKVKVLLRTERQRHRDWLTRIQAVER